MNIERRPHKYEITRGLPVIVTQPVIDHCKRFDCCMGCVFVGRLCVAPPSQHNFNEWLEHSVITIENYVKQSESL